MSLLPLLMSFTKAVPLLLLFRDVLLPLMFVVFFSRCLCVAAYLTKTTASMTTTLTYHDDDNDVGDVEERRQ